MKKLRIAFIYIIILVLVCTYIFLKEVNFDENQKEKSHDNTKFTYVQSDNLTLYEYVRYKYDNRGNKIEESTYMSDGNLQDMKKWEYDKNGNCISEYSYAAIGSKWEKEDGYKYFYKYDSENRIISITSKHSNGKSEYYYYQNGTAVDKVPVGQGWTSEYYYYQNDITVVISYNYDGNGDIVSHSEDVLNENGDSLCYYCYDSNGELDSYTYTRYDEQNRCICKVYGTNEDKPKRILKAGYDDERYVGKEVYKAELGLVKVQLNRYTEGGNLIRGLRYLGPEGEKWLDENNIHGLLPRDEDGEKILDEAYWADYDKDERVLNEMKYDSVYDYKLRSYEVYVYDENGNKSKKIEFKVDDNSDNIYYRNVITYQYDEYGNLILKYIEKINQDEKQISHTYKDGSSITLGFYDNESLLSVIKKDVQERYSEEIKFDETGKINCKEVYLYDGNKCKVNVYDIEDNLLYVKE